MSNQKDDKKREKERKEEEEQVEKLVKPSPKKKPPRTDRQNRRMKVKDTDLDSKDKDLSLNYKDIGGSLSSRVALRVLWGFEFEPIEDGEDDDDGESEPENQEDPKEPEETKEEAEPSEDSEQEDPKDEEPTQAELEEIREQEIMNQARVLYSEPDVKLLEMVHSGGDLALAAKKALELKQAPFPPDWDMKEVFDEGYIRLKARRRYRKHMSEWDAAAFARNKVFLEERLLNTNLTTGNRYYEDYYQALLDILEKGQQDFLKSDLKTLNSLEDLLEDLSNPEDLYDEDMREELSAFISSCINRLKRTSLDTVKNLLSEVEEALIGLPETTRRAVWLKSLHALLDRSYQMKDYKVNPKLLVAALRRGRAKAAQYRGLSGILDRDDYYTPDAPQWERPDPRDLTGEDYKAILVKASEEFYSDFLHYDLAQENPEMAMRIALDYAIYAMDSGKYANRIDAPTYNALLKAMRAAITG